ncbi:MAG: glycoside hydrolase family 13 protein [Bacteroidota bacterium]
MQIQREILYTSYQPDVEKVHIGFFPANGRYFIQEMKRRTDNVFYTKIKLPLGKSFYQYFINEDFDNPVEQAQRKGQLQDRVPYLLESHIFCPLEFTDEPKYICQVKDNEWEIRAISHQNWIESVELLTPEGSFPMDQVYQFRNKKYWSLRFDVRKTGNIFVLKFKGSSQTRYLHRGYNIQSYYNFKDAFLLVQKNDIRTRTAVQPGSVGYQIYPDSFSRSDKYDAPFQLNEWGAPARLHSHYGGDLQGVIERLDYLESLGIEFLYLNPIFEASTAHRYNCRNYRKIDPVLGNEEDFRQLVQAVHDRGMKIILDVSISHCGSDFPAFQDLLENQEKSRYKDWFCVHSFPVSTEKYTYESWSHYREMPLFNLENNEVRNYLLGSLVHWVENFDIDGWRIDVSTEIPEDFLSDIASAIRSYKSDVYLIGECWYHLNSRLVVEKGKLNGVTNFSLYWDAIMNFFVEGNTLVRQMGEGLLQNVWASDWTTSTNSWNFLDNHDTARFYSLLEQKEWYPLALAMIYAMPGNPVIFYGDEICMEGEEDPANRSSMNWHQVEENPVNVQWISQLNFLRKKYRDLFGFGSFNIVEADSDYQVIAIERKYQGENLTFIFNFSAEAVPLSITPILAALRSSVDAITRRDQWDTDWTIEPFSVKILNVNQQNK